MHKGHKKNQERVTTELSSLSGDPLSTPTLQSESSMEVQDTIDGLRNQDQHLTRDKLPEQKVSYPLVQNKDKKLDNSRKPEEKFPESIEKENVTDHKLHIFPLGMLMVALLMAALAVYMYNRQTSATSPTALYDSYKAELEKMQSKYINQTDRFWMTFQSGLEPIFKDDPDVPAVILLAVPDDHNSMASCFTQHVAEVLNKILGDVNPSSTLASFVDASELDTLNADEQKLKIDEKIHKIIESNQRTVIVSGLEKLLPQSILIFHGFCDNSEAVFKNIAIIFMLEFPAESNFNTDEEVYAYLFKLWNELGPSKTKALLVRMANNVAIMQRVNHFIC